MVAAGSYQISEPLPNRPKADHGSGSLPPHGNLPQERIRLSVIEGPVVFYPWRDCGDRLDELIKILRGGR